MSKWNELKTLAEKARLTDKPAHMPFAELVGAYEGFKIECTPAAILELIAENSSLKDLLAQAAAMIRNADVETGVCCCGSPVETHGFGDGHSPVDQGGYYALDLLSRIEAAMKEASHV